MSRFDLTEAMLMRTPIRLTVITSIVAGLVAASAAPAHAVGSWFGWENLGRPAGVSINYDPAVVAWDFGHHDVFVTSTASGLWHRYHFDGWGWSGWLPLGTPPGVSLASAPTAVSRTPGIIDVYVRGNDQQTWHVGFNGEWGGWDSCGGGTGAAPAAASLVTNWVDLFVRGADNQLYQKRMIGGQSCGSVGWQPRGGYLTSAPAARSPWVGQVDVFALGANGKTFTTNATYLDLEALWYEWWEPNTVVGGGVGATSNGVVMMNRYGNIAFFDGVERKWYNLGFPCPSSPCYWRTGSLEVPAAATWGYPRFDVYVESGGDIWHKWRN
jgi:hypothetical protein